MKVLKQHDNPSAAYFAALAQATKELEEGQRSAQAKHEVTQACAAGRLSIEICHHFCELGLNGTQFLQASEQRRLWDTGVDRERYFGRQIATWEVWERSRDQMVCEWTTMVDERIRSRSEAWISSDRVLAASLIAHQRRFLRTTLEARRPYLVITCGDNLCWKIAARAYLSAVAFACKEYDASLVKAFGAWTCSRSEATRELSNHERRIFTQLGLAGCDQTASYDAQFRKKLEAADRALGLAATQAARIEQDQFEAARCICNETAQRELIAAPAQA
jgi:hypothetical protein